MTLGDMQAALGRWFGESIDPALAADAINDSIQSLWMSLVQAQLSFAFNGPISLNIAAASERTTLVTIPDPTVVPTTPAIAGGTLPARQVFCAYTLVTESGSETNLSPVASVNVPPNELTQVTAPAWAAGALGWNCYLGSSAASLGLQNSDPIPFTVNFVEDANGAVDAPGAPAAPTSNTTADNVFYIQHLEVQVPDGTYRPWQQADIDTLLFQRFASSVASSSSYQPYVFDLVDQQTLEIRPALGAAQSPRYFYISKPRRLRFAASPLPFRTLPAEPFLRFYALSLITLAKYEYDAATAWGEKAEKVRGDLIQAVAQTNRPKQLNVTPFLP